MPGREGRGRPARASVRFRLRERWAEMQGIGGHGWHKEEIGERMGVLSSIVVSIKSVKRVSTQNTYLVFL